MPAPNSTTRRTKAERSDATRIALLDATIEVLASGGWAACSTRVVATRAGVSQGAQQYHFATKTELVDAAMIRLMHRLAAEYLQIRDLADDERERAGQLLDRLWEIHSLPVNRAVFELLNAARTDPDVAVRFGAILREAVELTRLTAEVLLPSVASQPGFEDFLLIAEALMRGAAIATIPGAESASPSWSAVRTHLLDALQRLATLPEPTDDHRGDLGPASERFSSTTQTSAHDPVGAGPDHMP